MRQYVGRVSTVLACTLFLISASFAHDIAVDQQVCGSASTQDSSEQCQFSTPGGSYSLPSSDVSVLINAHVQEQFTVPDNATYRMQTVLAELTRLQLLVAELSKAVELHSKQLKDITALRSSTPQDEHHSFVTQHSGRPEKDHTRQAFIGTGGISSQWLEHSLLLSFLRGQASNGKLVAAPLHVDLVYPAAEKPPRYVALGHADGNVDIYTTRGALVMHVQTGCSSPVTAMGSFPVRRNESVLVTGHHNGEVRMFTLTHQAAQPGSRQTVISQVKLRHVLPPGASVEHQQDSSAAQALPIAHILPVRSAARSSARRQVAVWDEGGQLRLQRDNGTLRLESSTNQTLLACSHSGVMLICMSATHAWVHKQQLSTFYRGYHCTNMNGTTLIAAAFDPARQHRAYGINDVGDLLILTVPHEKRAGGCKVVRTHQLKCLQRYRKPPAETDENSREHTRNIHITEKMEADTESSPFLQPGSISLAALRGYVIISHAAGTVLLNTSTIRMADTILEEPWTQLSGLLGVESTKSDKLCEQGCTAPSLTASALGNGLLLLGLPEGAGVAVLESELPIAPTLQQTATTPGKNMWAQPLLIGVMILVGFWQFNKARHRMGSRSTLLQQGARGMTSHLAGIGMGMDGAPRRRPMTSAAGQYRGMPPNASAAYEAALQQLQRDKAQGHWQGQVVGGEDDDEDDLSDDGNSRHRLHQARHRQQAYGGFTGPRSVRRAMKLGITPIAEAGPGQEELEDDGNDDVHS